MGDLELEVPLRAQGLSHQFLSPQKVMGPVPGSVFLNSMEF